MATERDENSYEYVQEGVEEEVEEEVEIEEEEEEEEEETSDAGESSASPATTRKASGQALPKPTLKRAQVNTPKTVGKVEASPEVKKMKMKSPSSSTLTPDKNPFTTHGAWTKADLTAIKISFPALTGKNETTNELTRSTRPEARYWKAPVTFSYASFSSDTIRFDGVHIPFHTAKNYGSGFVYMCLPGHAADVFASAGKVLAPTQVTEASLNPDPERWWKIANNVSESFGIINSETKKFHAKSLETIFDSTSAGITCSVILRFHCKASTTDTEALRPTTKRTLAAEVVRAYIVDTDVNVQPPSRVNRQKPKAEPVAISKDMASDSLMKRLRELGL